MKDSLINNIQKVHSTLLGRERIRKNLALGNVDVVEFCKNIILENDSFVFRHGKNFYVENKNVIITINSQTFSIITAHKN